MRWLTLIIAIVACVVLQTTVAPRLGIGGVRPDFLLLLAVFVAMHVRGIDVLAVGCLIGLMADAQSLERFGLLALTYTGATGVAYLLRDHVFRAHPLAHLAVTFVSGVILQGLLLAYCLAFTGVGGGSWSGQIFGGLLGAAYTALWAPPLHAVGLRVAPWVGLEVPRYARAGVA